MKISMRTVLLSVFLTWVVSAPTDAQDLSLGYQFARASVKGSSTNFPIGVNADVAFPMGEAPVQLVGQVDWSRKSGVNMSSYGAGFRWTGLANPELVPFGQGTVGATTFSGGGSSSTNLNFGIDGGVAFPLSKKISGVGEAGYRWIHTAVNSTNDLRFVVGIRIKLKSS